MIDDITGVPSKTHNDDFIGKTMINQDHEPSSPSSPSCCKYLHYDGVSKAKGYSLLGICRAVYYMSSIFMSASLLYLASQEAGCLVETVDNNDDDGINLDVDETCSARVHGFTPSALITNIAFISGLLSAFFMPLIGHRFFKFDSPDIDTILDEITSEPSIPSNFSVMSFKN